jgi:hypothetical protein
MIPFIYFVEHLKIYGGNTMAFFFKNKYASHPDVLDRIANRCAEIALSQIKDDLAKTKKPCTYCKYGYAGMEFNNQPLATSWNQRVQTHSLHFSDFNMEMVPSDDFPLFFSALLPHLQKNLDAKLKQYFPSATGVCATKATYVYYNTREDAIEIEVKGVRSAAPQTTPGKW